MHDGWSLLGEIDEKNKLCPFPIPLDVSACQGDARLCLGDYLWCSWIRIVLSSSHMATDKGPFESHIRWCW